MLWCYFFLFAIKLLTNEIIAKVDVRIMPNTRYKPSPPVSNDLGSLIPAKAININSVKRTAIWEIILFSFCKPVLQKNKITPKQTGISAVGELTSK